MKTMSGAWEYISHNSKDIQYNDKMKSTNDKQWLKQQNTEHSWLNDTDFTKQTEVNSGVSEGCRVLAPLFVPSY